MRRPIPRLIAAVAACLAAFVVWSLFPDHQPSARAFGDFAKALVEARSATFEITDKGEGFPEMKTRCYYLAPGKLRREVQIGGDEQVIIEDFATRRRLVLRPKEKTAMLFNERNAGPKTPWISNLTEQLRGLLSKGQDDQYKPIGEKEIDGRRAVGFRAEVPMQTMTLWGDPATGLPVLIERSTGRGRPRTRHELTMSHFKFNEDLKPELFDMTPPEDYTYRGIDEEASPPTDRLKAIAVAMLNHKDAKRAFPPAAIADRNGPPLLSWRVKLLPYLGEGELYNQFHLDERWDSEHNLPLVKKMPDCYASPGADKSAGKTVFLVPTGDKTIFFSDKGTTLREITDPLAGTILLVVAEAELAVPWTKPEDLIVDPANPADGLAREDGFFLVAWADGQVIPLPANVDAATLWAYFTRAGGEKVEWPKLPKP